MNAKFNFISDVSHDPVEVKQIEQSEYLKILSDNTEFFKLKSLLSKTWQDAVEHPEFFVKEINNEDYSIMSKTDNVSLVSVDNKELCVNISLLMNIAYREGAKHIIETIKHSM
jgi:hypothetical protein